MIEPVFKSQKPVIFIGAAEFRADDLSDTLTYASDIVAADGGLSAVLAAGLEPQAVIGDFDSATPEDLARVPSDKQFKISDQDTTDFEKCLERVQAPLVFALGFSGGRLDHELAVLHALGRFSKRRVVVVGKVDIAFLAPLDLRLDLKPGTRVSLVPLGPVTGSSQGLKWPIDGLEFLPVGQIGTSNEALGPVSLSFDEPRMLVVLPRQELSAAVQGLMPP